MKDIQAPHSDTGILVLGMGRSGMAATRLLRDRNRRVTVLDRADPDALKERADELRALGASVVAGARALDLPPGDFDLAVVSPGVRADSDWLLGLKRRGIPIVSELELGSRVTHSRILAVTGSNGKSTLAALCLATMRAAGLNAYIGGNFGEPMCALALQQPQAEWLVVEVSSFQMETSQGFCPDVGIWLNLHPTHLDRHGDMEGYAALKARMFLNMEEQKHAILFENAELVCPALRKLKCRKTTFGVSQNADFWYTAGKITWQTETGAPAGEVDLAGTPFDNSVMGATAAAAAAAANAVGLEPSFVAKAAAAYRRLPHRMQKTACVRDVCFVDDAKSTNLSATAAALEMTGGPVRLLAGGRLQEKCTAPVIEGLRKHAVAVYLWGETAALFFRDWSGVVDCRMHESMEQALEAAWRDARAGDTILLSPGCSSHDQYLDFNERGEAFVKAVNLIKQGAEK